MSDSKKILIGSQIIMLFVAAFMISLFFVAPLLGDEPKETDATFPQLILCILFCWFWFTAFALLIPFLAKKIERL